MPGKGKGALRGSRFEQFEHSSASKRPRETLGTETLGTEARPHAELFMRADQSVLGQLQLNLKSSYESILGALERLPMQIARAIPAVVKEAQEDAANSRQELVNRPIIQALDACRSCYDIGEVPGFRYYPGEHRIVCDDCFRYGKLDIVPSALSRGAANIGIIEGDCPAALGVKARAFKTVKAACKEHLQNSMLHDWCVTHAAEERNRAQRQTSAGVILALSALHTYNEHTGDRIFERGIALDNAKGLDIGTKNHARDFCRSLGDSFHAILVSGITRLLREPDPATLRPPPFAFLLDKATMLNSTGQMHGIICFVNGRLTAIFLGCLRVRLNDSSGSGLCEIARDVPSRRGATQAALRAGATLIHMCGC